MTQTLLMEAAILSDAHNRNNEWIGALSKLLTLPNQLHPCFGCYYVLFINLWMKWKDGVWKYEGGVELVSIKAIVERGKNYKNGDVLCADCHVYCRNNPFLIISVSIKYRFDSHIRALTSRSKTHAHVNAPLPLQAGFQSAARGLSQVSLPRGGVDRPQQVFSKKPEHLNFLRQLTVTPSP